MSEQMRDDGGQAFPGKKLARRWSDAEGTTAYETIPSAGMSLRDYFAAKALPVAIETMQRHRSALLSPFEWHKELELEIARACYALADAMLEARK